MKRKQGKCADCGKEKEIRAHGICSTCYSRRVYAGYRWDGPAPTVRLWGYKGPCLDCGATDMDRTIRQRCRRCYDRWKALHPREVRWRDLNEIRKYEWTNRTPRKS